MRNGENGLIKSRPLYITTSLVLLVVLIFSLLLAVTFGSVRIPLRDVYGVILYKLAGIGDASVYGSGKIRDVVWIIRLPRLLLSMSVGIGLAICGVIMQAVVKNPLAEPYTLGISSGASLGATIAILMGIGTMFGSNYVGVMAFLGAFGISLAVVGIANLGGRATSVKLLLAGMALSSICSAFSSFIVYFAHDRDGIKDVSYWLMGSFTSATYKKLLIGSPLILIGIVVIYLLRWRLNILSLSEDEAKASGINLKRTQMIFILASTVITASAVSMCGQVGWIGLLVPHCARMLVGSNNRYVVPISLSLGASFMILIDTLSRTISVIELPLSILTAIIGAPVFISLLNKNRSNLQ